MFDYVRDPAEITRKSFEIIGAEANLSGLPADIAPVAARIVHACGMPDVLPDLAFSEGAGAIGRAALERAAPILCDVRMVASGIMAGRLAAENSVEIAVEQVGAAELAAHTGQTRTAAGLELLAPQFSGAVVVIGNAPTALFRLLELVAAGATRPALVLGFPVGFVGAAESKVELAGNDSGLEYLVVHGRRGGSAIAAAAVNALAQAAE